MFVERRLCKVSIHDSSYLTGSQGLFIDSFPASADWYCRLGVGKLEEIRDGA